MTESNIAVVAVFDFGSARTKMLVASQPDGMPIQFDRYKEETGLGASVADTGAISESGEMAVLAAARRLKDKAVKMGCNASLAIGTDAYRRAVNGAAAAERLTSVVGSMAVLSPMMEGAIFFASMSGSLRGVGSLAVMDIGGGSVQLAWGPGEQVASVPTGTFRLERDFHPNRLPSDADYRAMRDYVERQIATSVPASVQRDCLVMGSTCMEEFLSSALSVGSGGGSESFDGGKRTTPLRLQQLFDEIRGRPYDTLAEYYPENPRFMFGGDKAIMNVLVAATQLRSRTVVPTDESVATSLARLALGSPASLDGLGVFLTRWDGPS